MNNYASVKSKKIIFIFLLFINFPLFGQRHEGLQLHNPDLFKSIEEHLPKSGTLRKTSDGIVYLDLDNNYIIEILKQLKDSSYAINRGFNNVGAHILVMHSDESKGKKIHEIGKKFKFEPIGFYSIFTDYKEYLMLAIHSPSLIKLREKYGLNLANNNYSLHIKLGFRKYDN